MSDPASSLTLRELIRIVGQTAFDAACNEAFSSADGSVQSDVPHQLSNRLWYEGPELLGDRIAVAAELYHQMPCYANLMYWPEREFDEDARTRMWAEYRRALSDPSDRIAEPVAYSLWVDYFEDVARVERAWTEVAGLDEPRRPRLQRVISGSGPVPWELKAPVYEFLAAEGGWEDALLDGLYGSVIDIYGSLEREPALRLLQRLRNVRDTRTRGILAKALADPALPDRGADRRLYVIDLQRES
jgi:hypothetical protein